VLEGFFRSPRSIIRATGSTKCGRYLLRFRLACGLAWDKARLGAPGLGRVRSLAFLSILRDRSAVVPHGWILEILACQRSFSATC
jgi:hypothetical protein